MLTRILYYYYKAIYLNRCLNSSEQLVAHQKKCLNHLVNNTLIHSPFYQRYLDKPFEEWPIMSKKLMNQYFDEINTAKIKKSEALAVALRAEQSRDFSPLIDRIAVGLSSGTSGDRGLFLTNPKERDAWAGVILAKVLPQGFKTQERIAFFLRANNQLYTTLNKSKKIQFHFFDLLACIEEQITQLNQLQPTILSAPASVLRFLAQEQSTLKIAPKRIVSVAEVLDPCDEALISAAFNLPVAQIYQCTEGFLAATDKASNTLTMNEEFLIIEKEWIDEHRFIPIITDLMRTTQPIIRYRLDDVLIAKQSTSIFTELSAIEGRLGDVLYGTKGNEIQPIFADSMRQCMANSPIHFEDYLICQNTMNELSIQVSPEPNNRQLLIDHLNQLFIQKGCETPQWIWEVYVTKEKSHKVRRIQSKMDLTQRRSA